MPTRHPLRRDGSVMRNTNFFKGLQAFPWRREWVKAVLRCIRMREDICPPDQPIHSLEALDYLETVSCKLTRGIKNIKFEEVYYEWIRLLVESGFIHPIWYKEDCEFVRNTLSSEQTTVDIFQEIISFKRQGMLFTYELLGFSHSDMDEVFDWTRVTDSIRAGGIDEPWMRLDSSSEENPSVSLSPANETQSI